MAQVHKIDRPLDWVAVTDHAEYIGEMYSAMVEGAPGHDQDQLKELRSMTDVNERRKWFATYVSGNNRGEHPQHPPFYAGTGNHQECVEGRCCCRRRAQ